MSLLPPFCHAVVALLSGGFSTFSALFWHCCRAIARVLWNCCRDVFELLRRGFCPVVALLLRCYRFVIVIALFFFSLEYKNKSKIINVKSERAEGDFRTEMKVRWRLTRLSRINFWRSAFASPFAM